MSIQTATCTECGEDFTYDAELFEEEGFDEPELCSACAEELESCGLQHDDFYPDDEDGDGEHEDDFFNNDEE